MARKHKRRLHDSEPVDLDAVAKLPGCELWTRTIVMPWMPRMSALSCVLLYTEMPFRKMTFQLYDMRMGKRNKTLPFDAFLKDELSSDRRATLWYYVFDIQSERLKLASLYYEKYEK